MITTTATQWIELETAPALPGLKFRAFRGEVDYPEMLKVINGHKHADQLDRSDSLEDIARNYSHLTNCDPYSDMLFAEVDGETAAYGRVSWSQEPAGGLRRYFSLGFMRPEWRRMGIGSAMLGFLQERLRQIAEGHPRDGERVFELWALQTEAGTHALAQKDGYHAARHFYEMVRPDLENIEAARLPDGFSLRQPRPDEYRKLWDASQEFFQDHWGYVPEGEEEFQKWLGDPSFDPSLWRVAWAGDEIAGMVLSFILADQNQEYGRLRGYTENICVRRSYRKRGLAHALILLSLQALKERGMREAALGVDAENISGALRLYESVGFRQVKRTTNYFKAME